MTWRVSITQSITLVLILILGSVLVRSAQAQEPVTVLESNAPPPTEEVERTQNIPPPYVKEGIPGGDAVIGDFVVGPGKIDVSVKPGETKVVQMTVTNRTGERRVFNLTTEDMTGSHDVSKPVVLLGNERGPYSLKDYLKVDHRSFELGQNERARIPVTISVPLNAEPGGLYGSMLVDTVAIESVSGEAENTVPQSAIIARIGTLFFVTVEGEITRDGKLTDFGTLSKQHFFGNGPITFGILHENNGSMHITPYGELRITNFFGEEVGAVELDPWFVLPDSERLREVKLDREFLMGQYTATVHINRSYEDIVDTLSFTFWVLPWKIVVGVFGALFMVIFIIRAFFRRFEFKRKS